MPGFFPFRGVRYASPTLDDVISPPYDVLSQDDRAALAARSDHNAVHVESPDSYADAAARWRAWLDEGALRVDDEPGFYAYRMTYDDESGSIRRTTGFFGALALSDPDEGQVLPHERTTPKDKADRTNLLAATRVNVSPIWALTPVPGISELAPTDRAPDASARDTGGVLHELWQVTDTDTIAAIRDRVALEPALIADGHHRYEVANAYRAELGPGGPQDRILTFLVELSDNELTVQAIHRLLTGLPDGFDLVDALRAHFDVQPTDPADASIRQRMTDAGALALVTVDGTWLLRPLPATNATAAHDLDSSRLDVALGSLPSTLDVTFQHGVDLVAAAVEKGDAQAGVLLRPATVSQIAAISRGGERMPPKTTFFHPKLATGMVFRSLDLD